MLGWPRGYPNPVRRAPPAGSRGGFPLENDTAERPLRVLVLTWRDGDHPEAGGAEVYVERTSQLLSARGHTVTMFSAAFPGAARSGGPWRRAHRPSRWSPDLLPARAPVPSARSATTSTSSSTCTTASPSGHPLSAGPRREPGPPRPPRPVADHLRARSSVGSVGSSSRGSLRSSTASASTSPCRRPRGTTWRRSASTVIASRSPTRATTSRADLDSYAELSRYGPPEPHGAGSPRAPQALRDRDRHRRRPGRRASPGSPSTSSAAATGATSSRPTPPPAG